MRLFVLLLAVKASGLAVRLNKLLPGLSRRKADAAIADGRVTVDGVVADGRTPVERGSEVRLDGETQVWEAREAAKADLKSSDAFLYLKYWKPAGVTCTSDRDDASNVIARGGFDALDQRVFTVGRLDKPSTGLLLLTSDGRACEALLRPSRKKEKRYLVEVDRAPTADDLRALQEGVTTPLSGVDYEHSTCVVVGDQIMVFGGSNARHGGHNKGESLEDQLAYIRENNVGGRPRWDDLLLDHVRKAYEAEKFNYCWRIELDADGDMHELTFGRAGARISGQSENAAAVVVYL